LDHHGGLESAAINHKDTPDFEDRIMDRPQAGRADDQGSLLERMILLGENSLRKAIGEFPAHYHAERNHQGLGNRPITPVKKILRRQDCPQARAWKECSIVTIAAPRDARCPHESTTDAWGCLGTSKESGLWQDAMTYLENISKRHH
jgi:hypothetical protein